MSPILFQCLYWVIMHHIHTLQYTAKFQTVSLSITTFSQLYVKVHVVRNYNIV